MGSVIEALEPVVEIDLTVGCTAPLAYCEVIRGTSAGFEVIESAGSGAMSLQLVVEDELATEPSLYYLRLRQENGEMAWSSPVWLKVGG